MRGINRFLESRKHTIHVTGFREQRQLQPKAPQMETPKKSKPAAPRNQETRGLGAYGIWEARMGWGLGERQQTPRVFYSTSISHPAPDMLTLPPSWKNAKSFS